MRSLSSISSLDKEDVDASVIREEQDTVKEVIAWEKEEQQQRRTNNNVLVPDVRSASTVRYFFSTSSSAVLC